MGGVRDGAKEKQCADCGMGQVAKGGPGGYGGRGRGINGDLASEVSWTEKDKYHRISLICGT